MPAELNEQEHIKMGVEALLSEGGQNPTFILAHASYYPSENSSIHNDEDFRILVEEFGEFWVKRPFDSYARGFVTVQKEPEGIYTAELDLYDIRSVGVSRFTGRLRDYHLDEIPVPFGAFKPNGQRITGHSNIIDGSMGGSLRTLYTSDFEGSNWSLHLAKPGVVPNFGPTRFIAPHLIRR